MNTRNTLLTGITIALLAITTILPGNKPTARADALSVVVVTSCGTQSLTAGQFYPAYMDATGKLCDSGGGGGGGGGGPITGPLGPTTVPSAAVAITDTGTPINGQAIPTGGQGLTGWLSALYAATLNPIAAGTNTIGNVGQVYPAGSTPITASATGTTGATTATLAANASLHTYICGLSIRANATAAATGNATVTGTITATMNFTQWTAPAASGLGVTEEIFTPCITSSAINTGIAVISAAPGTGGVISVSAWGFQL